MEIEKTIQDKGFTMNFTLYSKDGCPYCEKILQVLEFLKTTKGALVTEYKLNVDFKREEFYKEFGVGSTFPQVIFNGNKLGGSNSTIRFLSENKLL